MVFSALVAGAFVWFVSDKFLSVPYAILVDGKQITDVQSLSAAVGVLDTVRLERAHGVPVGSVRFVQNVTFRRTSKSSEIADVPEAERSLEKVTTVEGELYAIDVNGEPTVAFADKSDADETLKLLKDHYESKFSDRKVETTFKGRVSVDQRYVNLDKFKVSPADAVAYLTSVSEPPREYIMQAGDRVARLAVKYHVPLMDLKKLNPDQNLDRLVVGDRIIIQPAKMPITVVSKVTTTKTENVEPPHEGRRRHVVQGTGKREMQVQVIYENGREVNQEVISQITTWDRPKPSQASSR
jgi:LysM repeat protein